MSSKPNSCSLLQWHVSWRAAVGVAGNPGYLYLQHGISIAENMMPNHWNGDTQIFSLVGALEHFLFSHILGIIIPIDFHIFQRGSNHQPVLHASFKRCAQLNWIPQRSVELTIPICNSQPGCHLQYGIISCGLFECPLWFPIQKVVISGWRTLGVGIPTIHLDHGH